MTKVQHPSTGGQVNGEVTSTPDPFDPKLLREEAIADIDVEKVLLTVPVRKPRRTEFFRVHRCDDYVTDTYIFEHDDGMDIPHAGGGGRAGRRDPGCCVLTAYPSPEARRSANA